MSTRIDHHKINPSAVTALASTYRHISSIEPKLRSLIEIRVSQINGCAFCLNMHTVEARKEGETDQRIDCLAGWRECNFYTERERAALAWAESVTRIADTHAPDEVYAPLAKNFSEKEIVDLTFIIGMINTWNRLAISLRKEPDDRS